jgi:NADPH:quinone reductase-like Zn-dependent oxidoreductase
MKAIVLKKFGSPENFEVRTAPKPLLTDDSVLVKIHATSVTSADWRVRSLKLPRGFGFMGRLVFGFFKPRQNILGTELAGVVEAVGSKITKFKVGDAVVAQTGIKFGAYCEYRCFKENEALVKMLTELSFTEAASLSFGATTAWYFLGERIQVYPDNHILINGASGSVGSAAIQIAKSLGARVTAVCSSTHFDFVRSLGADDVIDYKKTQFYENGKNYDVIMDITGHIGYSMVKKSLKPNGRLVLVAADLPQMLEAIFANYILGKKVVIGTAEDSAYLIQKVLDLVRQKKFRPVIDSTYKLEQMAEAHRHAETRSRQGNIAIKVVS